MGAGNSAEFIRMIAVGAIPVIFAITLHEVAHGWMARRFGDRTAEMLGRLSLNPMRHVDPLGTVLVPLLTLWMGGLLFGWAKPVPINPRAMRNPRHAMVAVAAAGPAANLLMALGWALALRLAAGLLVTAPGIGEFLRRMAEIGIFINLLLLVFNLLPILPLDGGRVLRGLVPEAIGRRLDVLEPYGLIIVLGLLFLGAFNEVLGPLLMSISKLFFLLGGVKGG